MSFEAFTVGGVMADLQRLQVEEGKVLVQSQSVGTRMIILPVEEDQRLAFEQEQNSEPVMAPLPNPLLFAMSRQVCLRPICWCHRSLACL